MLRLHASQLAVPRPCI